MTMTMVHHEERGLARVEPTPRELIQLGMEKGLTPEQLAVLVDLEERLANRKAAADFADAIAEFQRRKPIIYKGREVKAMGYSFAGYDDIMRQIQPLLSECGLSVGFSFEMADGCLVSTCHITHGTHTKDYCLPVAIPKGVRVNDAQQSGIAIAYAKRYALCGALNLVVSDEDTDANGMGETITEEQAITLGEMFEAFPNPGEERARFLDVWAKVETIADLPASRYDMAVSAIKKKLATLPGRGTR